MFCNLCGKENKDGTKFCIQCGKPLQSVEKNVEAVIDDNNGTESISNSSKTISSGVKALIVMGTILVLVLIAGVNILKVNMAIFNVNIRNDELNANSYKPICETNAYIYYNSDGIYRADKATQTVKRVSNKSLRFISVTSNAVYCIDDNNNCYRMADNSSELEKLTSIPSGGGIYVFLDGKYNYTLDHSGTLTKRLNSDKYNGYSINLYTLPDDWNLMQAKIYKNYLYMTISDSFESSNGNKLIRVSLDSGDQEYVSNENVIDFHFSGNQIVCSSGDGGFVKMNLRGNNVQEYTGIDNIKSSSFFCCNGYVYYSNGGKLCRFNVDGDVDEELDSRRTYLTAISSGLAYTSGNELTLYDYDGNEIAVMKP